MSQTTIDFNEAELIEKYDKSIIAALNVCESNMDKIHFLSLIFPGFQLTEIVHIVSVVGSHLSLKNAVTEAKEKYRR